MKKLITHNSSLLTILLCIVNCAFCINLNAQEKEFRASWVATVWNIDWPTTQITKEGNATQIAAQKAELVTIIERAKQGNLNAIMLQVRSHGDALYASSYEPWGHHGEGRDPSDHEGP